MNRIKCHVRKGDQVEVISGNFRGSSGKILAVYPRKQRVLVEGVRIIKKHLRKHQNNPSGKIAEREGPIHISNVKLIEREKKGERKNARKRSRKKRRRKKRHDEFVENGKRISSLLQRDCHAGAAEAARLQERSPGSKGRESSDQHLGRLAIGRETGSGRGKSRACIDHRPAPSGNAGQEK